ncbi:MAG TPA: hypothetical protein VGL04_03995 [Sporichthyaceae bacterium]|jgi:hypothetical protein
MFNPQPILDRLNAASPGPWQRHGADVHGPAGRLFTGRDDSAESRAQADRDAEFVAHARADVAELLAELARLQGEPEP